MSEVELTRFSGLGVSLKEAYDAGKDCALSGANTTNCHFKYFGSKALMEAWSRGKKDATPAPPR